MRCHNWKSAQHPYHRQTNDIVHFSNRTIEVLSILGIPSIPFSYLLKAIFFLVEEETPYESDVWQGTDGDSGRDSTAHSPEGSKASSPNNTRAGKSCIKFFFVLLINNKFVVRRQILSLPHRVPNRFLLLSTWKRHTEGCTSASMP